jgi:predicted MFS family arabinose efflux permease
VVLSALAIFVAASVGCALAANIGMFLLFRAMQASIDACFCVALVIIRETYGARGAASRLGYLAMGWAVAPMVGPVFGGLLDGYFGWRASFVVFALLGAAALAISMRQIRDGSFQAPRSGGNHFAVYRQLFRSAQFWAYAGCMTFSMGTFYIFLGGAPLIAARLLGVSGPILGLYVGMVPTGFVIGSYLAGRYASRVRPGTALISARLLTCLGLTAGIVLSLMGFTHALALFGPCMLIGIGNGLTMPTANAGILSIRTDFTGTAIGLAAAIRIGGGAVIASIASLFLRHSGAIDTLFGLMLASASLALLAAIFAALLDRRTAV